MTLYDYAKSFYEQGYDISCFISGFITKEQYDEIVRISTDQVTASNIENGISVKIK